MMEREIERAAKHLQKEIIYCEPLNDKSYGTDTFLVTTAEDTQYVIRFHQNDLNFEQEVRAMMSLPKISSFIPKVLKSWKHENEEGGVLVYTYIPGKDIPEAELDSKALKNVGQALGKLHKSSQKLDELDKIQSFSLITGEQWWETRRKNFFKHYGALLSKVDYATSRKCFDVARSFFNNQSHELSMTLIHGNYQPQNIIFEGDNVKGLVDFSATSFGDPVYDLRHFSLYLRTRDSKLWADFMAGYLSEMDLQEADLERLCGYELEYLFEQLSRANILGERTLFQNSMQTLEFFLDHLHEKSALSMLKRCL